MPLIQEHRDGVARICQWSAPAKVNIFLRITGRRPNGYHDLESLMTPLALADVLMIRRETGAREELEFKMDGAALAPDDENIVVRAVKAYREASSEKLGVINITLKKIIPIAAGLGGGSSDAASALLALNFLADKPLPMPVLAAIGVRLGADVPFFLHEKPCLARGIGEMLTPLAVSKSYGVVLVNPNFAVSTRWVYENLDLALTAKARGETIDMSEEKLAQGDWSTLLQNDLERVTVSKYPQLEEIKAALKSLGAKGALMSGSGPTVFGLFAGEAQAKNAAQSLAKQERWKVFATKTV